MNLTSEFNKYLKTDEEFKLAYQVVRKNSRGKIWLIGGGLSRNLANILYGYKKENHDFDFIVETPIKKIKLEDGWKVKLNNYGSPKFIKKDLRVDFIHLDTISSIKRRKLKPTIKNFLTGTPFTIQSMAYDVGNQRIIGKMGILALKKKIFEVNNQKQAKIYASHKGLTVKKLILKKAKSMGFEPKF
jgi:hypothetical protein